MYDRWSQIVPGINVATLSKLALCQKFKDTNSNREKDLWGGAHACTASNDSKPNRDPFKVF